MKAFDRLAEQVQQIGVVTVRAGLEKTQHFAIEVDGDLVAQRTQRRVRFVEVIVHVGDRSADAIDDRAQRRRPVRERLDDLDEELDRVGETAPGLDPDHLRRGDLATALCQCHEATREISAVDGRHVARQQRLEISGGVPVEEVSAVAFEPPDTVDRPAQARHQLAGPEIPRSYADSVASSISPMFVGDVRCAVCS